MFNRKILLQWVVVLGALMIGFSIAVPWMLEGQVISMVSRVGNDLRSMARSLEEFYAAHDHYPAPVPLPIFAKVAPAHLTTIDPGTSVTPGLTTPVAYLTSIYGDVFWHVDELPRGFPPIAYAPDSTGWILFSAGPNRVHDILPERDFSSSDTVVRESLLNATFDVTNGTTSRGDIWRAKASFTGDFGMAGRLYNQRP